MTDAQEICRADRDYCTGLTVHVPNHRASWTTFAGGAATATFSLHRSNAPRLAMALSETAAGRVAARQTMLTLDEEATRALYDLLRERFA